MYEFCNELEMSERESFLSFIVEVIAAFGNEYIRSLYEADLRRILAINFRCKFRGFVSS